MTSVVGALWTVVQSIGWLLYFLRQLISDTLNINYRLVSAVGHLIAGIAKILYVLLSSVGMAVYDFASHVLLTVAGIFSFTIDCLYFVVHCCTLLFKIIYYTITGVADGLVFVLLMPVCACQTLHSWILWIFNAERWLNAAVWCLQTCNGTFTVVQENVWWLLQYLLTTVFCWLSTVATFTYDYTMMSCSTVYTGLILVYAGITEGITSSLFVTWCSVLILLKFVVDCFLAAVINPLCELLQLCVTNYFCLIPIVLSVLVLVLFRGSQLTRFLRRNLWHSGGEVIQINFNDVDDIIDVSDDEQDNFPAHVANVFHFAEDDQADDNETEYTDDDSSVAVSTDETSDDSVIGSDSDTSDSDRETIDIQLPDQATLSASGRQHGYATRSKGTVEQPSPPCVDHERERSLCVICQDQVKSVLVLPCRHMCMCVDCARTVVSGLHGQRRICPLCRANIRIVMNVYT